MRKLTIIVISIIVLIFSFFSCGIGGPAGKYLSHINKVRSIIIKNPDDAAAAAQAVYEYVEKNQSKIEEASVKMKELSAAETEKVYLPVVKATYELVEYVKANTTEEYPLGSQEKLGLALRILFK